MNIYNKENNPQKQTKLLNMHLWRTCYGPGTALGSKDTPVNMQGSALFSKAYNYSWVVVLFQFCDKKIL